MRVAVRRFGVEEELLRVHPETGAPTAMAASDMVAARRKVRRLVNNDMTGVPFRGLITSMKVTGKGRATVLGSADEKRT